MSEPPAASRREVGATIAIVGAMVLLVAARPVARRLARHPTAERCVAMLDRYAEHEERARDRVPGPRTARPSDAPDVVSCVRELTDEEVDCALRSGNSDELERCLP